MTTAWVLGYREKMNAGDRFAIHRHEDLAGVELIIGCTVGRTSVRHMHERYRIGLVTGGSFRTRYGGRRYEVSEGAIQLAEPQVVSSCQMAGGAQQFVALVIDDDRVHQITDEPGFRRGVISHVVRDKAVEHLIRDAVTAIADHATLLERSTRLTTLLTAAMGERGWTSREQPVAARTGIQRAKEFIDDQPGADPSVSALAQLAGLSTSQFTRVFRRQVGVTPHAYQLHRRIESAKVSLRGEVTIAQLSADLGFFDQGHFTRHFRLQVGMTPRSYQRALA